MLFLILFGALTFKAHEGTVTYEECKSLNFSLRACKNAKDLKSAGEFLCKVQGKVHDGNSSCVK